MDRSEQPEPSNDALSPFIIEDEWIEREFRIYNRALRSLEAQFENQRSEQSRRIEALESQLRELSQTRPVEPPPLAPLLPVAAECQPAMEHSPVGHVPPAPAGTREIYSRELEAARLAVLDTAEPERQRPNNSRTVTVLSALSVVLSIGVAGAYTSFTGSQPPARTTAPVQKASGRPVTIIDASRIERTGTGEVSPQIKRLMARAKKGDVQAELALATAYLRGDGVEADPASAMRWSQLAANAGDPSAQFILGTLYANGIKPDSGRALRWYVAAAAGGNVKAMHNMAVTLATGAGIKKDPVAAVNWFKHAAKLGYRDSAFDLAVMYERGEGIAQNKQEALRWYDQAAATGDLEAKKRAAWLRTNP